MNKTIFTYILKYLTKTPLHRLCTILIIVSLTLIVTPIIISIATTHTETETVIYWREKSQEPISNKIPVGTTELSWENSAIGRIVRQGTSPNAIVYENHLDTNCAIDQTKFILSNFNNFIDTHDNSEQSAKIKD